MNERLQSDCRHHDMPHLSTNKTLIPPSTQSIYTHFEIGKHNFDILGRRRLRHGADFAARLRHMLRRRWLADSWICFWNGKHSVSSFKVIPENPSMQDLVMAINKEREVWSQYLLYHVSFDLEITDVSIRGQG